MFYSKKMLALPAFGFALAAMATQAMAAGTYKVIYNFCSLANCSDGDYGGVQNSGLSADASGNLYGATTTAGPNNNGTVFELVKGKKGYTYRLLYAFGDPNLDGTQPQGRLVVDRNGNLYGVMAVAGPHEEGQGSAGVLFKITPGAQNPYQVLHVFCRDTPQYCADGATPQSLTYVGATQGTLYDGTSPLYGMTYTQGQYGGGTAFTYTPGGDVQTVHAFCYVNKQHFICDDGSSPSGLSVVSSSGNFYGANGYGKKGAAGGLLWDGSGNEVINQFKCDDNGSCKFGSSPNWGISLDEADNLVVGATASGGAGYGVAFGVDTEKHKQTFAISLCRKTDCQDTGLSSSTLFPDGMGGAVGTTSNGGAVCNAACGTLYRVDLSTKKLKVLHSFGGTDDGGTPFGGTLASGGSLFGLTASGGANGYGVVYQYTP